MQAKSAARRFRSEAQQLRQMAKEVHSDNIRHDLEALARQYEGLAAGVEGLAEHEEPMLRAMIDDSDVFGAAKLLIDQYGEGAALQAAQSADELVEAGDLAGVAAWRRIFAAIEELRRGKREDGPLD
jgi:hypothetical protein